MAKDRPKPEKPWYEIAEEVSSEIRATIGRDEERVRGKTAQERALNVLIPARSAILDRIALPIHHWLNTWTMH